LELRPRRSAPLAPSWAVVGLRTQMERHFVIDSVAQKVCGPAMCTDELADHPLRKHCNVRFVASYTVFFPRRDYTGEQVVEVLRRSSRRGMRLCGVAGKPHLCRLRNGNRHH